MHKKFLFVLVLIFVSACSAITVTPTQTVTPIPTLPNTPFAPLSRGTPLPLMYQPINPETASSVTLLARWNVGAEVTQRLVFMPDSNKLLLGAGLWHVLDGSPDYSEREYRLGVNNNSPFSRNRPWESYSPDGEFMVEYYLISGMYIVDRNLPTNWRLHYHTVDGALGITFTPDSRYLVIWIDTGKIWFVPTKDWVSKLKKIDLDDNSDLRPEQVIDVGAFPEDVAFSQDGSTMVVATKDDTVQIWDAPSLSYRLTIKNIDKSTNLAFSPDGQMIAAGLTDRQIGLWNTHSGQPITRLQGSTGVLKSIAFSPNSLLLGSLDDKDGVLLWGILPRSNSLAAAKTATTIAQRSFSSSTPVPPSPTPSATPTVSLPNYSALPWPITAPTDEQLDEVRSCNIEQLDKIRYPETLNYWDVGKAYTPQSACDWATLAVAYQEHQEDKNSISEDGKRAFYQAFILNPAFALQTQIYYNYFGSVNFVSAPRIAQRPIKSLTIDYQWSGMGEPSSVEYHVRIDQAHIPEKMRIFVQTGHGRSENRSDKKIDSNLVQAIGPAMVNLIPIRSPFQLDYCTDNSPDWAAKVTFLDGTVLQLNTNGSDLLRSGGPWHIKIGAKNYTQFSSDLLIAFGDLFDALDLRFGQPMSMFCAPVGIFDQAYP